MHKAGKYSFVPKVGCCVDFSFSRHIFLCFINGSALTEVTQDVIKDIAKDFVKQYIYCAIMLMVLKHTGKCKTPDRNKRSCLLKENCALRLCFINHIGLPTGKKTSIHNHTQRKLSSFNLKHSQNHNKANEYLTLCVVYIIVL